MDMEKIIDEKLFEKMVMLRRMLKVALDSMDEIECYYLRFKDESKGSNEKEE